MTTNRPPTRLYFPTLDGLRFFAFLLVFVHHLPASPTGWLKFVQGIGWTGVPIFFALSAYLLTAILREEHQQTGRISVPRFFVRRALRIWPLYVTFCTGAYVTTVLLFPHDHPYGLRYATSLAFVDNFLAGPVGLNPLPFSSHLWTVCVEEQFYLLLPCVLAAMIARPRRLLWSIGLAWLACVAIRGGLVAAGVSRLTIWTSLVAADALFLGTAAALVRPGDLKGWPTVTAVAGGLLIGLCGLLPDITTEGRHHVIVYTVVGAGAVLLMVGALESPALRFLGCPWLRYLGKISYGLYVYHFVGMFAATRVCARTGLTDWWSHTLISLVCTIGFSAASYAVLEKPFLLLKRRFETIATRPV